MKLSVRKIVRETRGDANYKFSSIVLGIVKTPAFQSSEVEITTNEQPAKQVAAK